MISNIRARHNARFRLNKETLDRNRQLCEQFLDKHIRLDKAFDPEDPAHLHDDVKLFPWVIKGDDTTNARLSFYRLGKQGKPVGRSVKFYLPMVPVFQGGQNALAPYGNWEWDEDRRKPKKNQYLWVYDGYPVAECDVDEKDPINSQRSYQRSPVFTGAIKTIKERIAPMISRYCLDNAQNATIANPKEGLTIGDIISMNNATTTNLGISALTDAQRMESMIDCAKLFTYRAEKSDLSGEKRGAEIPHSESMWCSRTLAYAVTKSREKKWQSGGRPDVLDTPFEQQLKSTTPTRSQPWQVLDLPMYLVTDGFKKFIPRLKREQYLRVAKIGAVEFDLEIKLTPGKPKHRKRPYSFTLGYNITKIFLFGDMETPIPSYSDENDEAAALFISMGGCTTVSEAKEQQPPPQEMKMDQEEEEEENGAPVFQGSEVVTNKRSAPDSPSSAKKPKNKRLKTFAIPESESDEGEDEE